VQVQGDGLSRYFPSGWSAVAKEWDGLCSYTGPHGGNKALCNVPSNTHSWRDARQTPKFMCGKVEGVSCTKTKLVNPAYSACKASSIWGGDPIGRSHGLGRLGSSQAWSARHNRKGEWWQIDAGSTKPIVGVRTQGRHGGTSNQRVTAYKVTVSKDGSSWEDVDGGKVFKANIANSHTTVDNRFAKPVLARYVRLIVESWAHHVSMRAALDEGQDCS